VTATYPNVTDDANILLAILLAQAEESIKTMQPNGVELAVALALARIFAQLLPSSQPTEPTPILSFPFLSPAERLSSE